MRKHAYLIDSVIAAHLKSGDTQEKIRKALSRSLNVYSQNIQLQISETAEQAVADFRDALRKGLQNFVDEWITTKGTFEVVPEGTRLLKAFGSQKLLIVEQKPTVRSLLFDSKYGSGVFRLALPYVEFLIWFDGYNVQHFQMGFAKKPLENLESKVYYPFLPNISGYGFCMGDVRVQGTKRNICGNANFLIEQVWNSTFNNDQDSQFVAQATYNGKFSRLRTWQIESEKNPLFVLGTKWHSSSMSVGDLLKDSGDGQIKLVFSPIIRTAVDKASKRLRNAFGEQPVDGKVDKQLKKAAEIFRTELYDVFFAACSEVAETVETECGGEEADAVGMLKALERRLDKAYSANEEAEKPFRKVGEKLEADYSYRPPWDKVW